MIILREEYIVSSTLSCPADGNKRPGGDLGETAGGVVGDGVVG